MDDYDVDLNWDDDDFFGGDMDFDDNFDMDPFKNKSFLSAAAEGFLGSVVNGSVGSSDAFINTARTYLPSSFSTGLDRLRYFKDKGNDLVREFQEGNYESVKSLQSIAKTISGKISNENSFLKEKLDSFSSKDFSSWEKGYSNRNEELGSMEQLSDDEIDSQLASMMQNQSSMLASVGDGINQMAAAVGGRSISAIMAGNKELIGIQGGLRDLLDYHRRVQAKMDSVKIELLARTFMLNAKFYKFMEKGLHAEVKELKKIALSSAQSDYEKTSHFQATKGKVRDAVLQRAGGLFGSVRENLGKNSREEKYNAIESALSQIVGVMEMGGDITPSWGMAGNMFGGMAGQWAMSELPRFLNQGPFQNFKKNLFKNNPDLEERYNKVAGKVSDVGNAFSYNMNNAPGLLQYYSQYWENLDEYKYADYEDYVEQTEATGKKPMPKAAFTVMNSLANQGKGFANRMMSTITEARGSRYALRHRNATELAKAGVWKEINNVTLNDVIPGWLRMQYETLEKIRTGNDGFTAPTFSYNRGQFVSNKNARAVVQSDVFSHSSFSSAANNASKLASSIDKEGVLTEAERKQLTLKLIQDADKEYGFNPYYYINGIGSEDQGLNDRVAKMMRDRFDITPEKLAEYENADIFGKGKMAAFGFKGEVGADMNELGSLAQSLKETVPNIQDNISASRSAGNDQILRDLGIILTKNGSDQFNMDKFWERMMQYINNPEDVTLRGDVDTSGELHAGDTVGGGIGGNSRRDSSDIAKKSRKISNQADNLRNTAENTTQVLNETMTKLVEQIDAYGKVMSKADFSKIQIDLDTIPDNLSSIRELIEKMQAYDSRQESLLEQIAGCVCRSAGSWNKMDDQEKADILKQEAEGKKTLMDRLREMNPKKMIDKGIAALINNQPLVLGGILGGLGVLALHDPKAAMFISGGMVAAKIYSKLGDIARARSPENDEDILDEDGNVILKASKLREGHYYDMVEKRVIKEWKEIKGAIYDVANKTYVTLATLTGKLFGPDGRAVIINGLSKVRDALVRIWNKVDIFGHMGSALTKGKEMFYQQDVYVKGEKEPRLTRGGFQTGKYYRYDLGTREPFPIKGWNEIKGPVYELGPDGSLNQIISEADAAQGLVTSSGVAIEKLGSIAKWTGLKTFDLLGKAKDYGLEKAGLIKEKTKEIFKNDYSGIEDRIDRIYYLLCKHFGITPSDLPTPGNGPVPPSAAPGSTGNPVDDIINGVKTATTDPDPDDGTKVNDPFGPSQYPNSIRLNSFEDQENKEEKKKQDQFYDDVHGIRTRMDEDADFKDDGKGEKKKGILGTIAGWLVGKDSFLRKLITNPIGFVVGGLFNNILKAPGRIITMGSLLFKGVMGIGSPIYNILSWGFGGLMWGIRKLIFTNTESFGDWFGGRRGDRNERRRRRRGRNRRFRMAGKFGKIAGAALTAWGAYEGYKGIQGVMDAGSSARDILSKSSNEYGRFFDTPENEDADEQSTPNGVGSEAPQSNLGEGFTTTEAIPAIGLGAAQAIGTAKTLGMRGAGAAGAGGIGAGERVAGKLIGKTAAKVGAKAVPILGQALMAMDAYDGFTNKEEVGQIFNKNVINGKERLANGLSNVLDLGGAVSGTMNWAADKTGFEFLRQEGGMTRAIDSALSALSWGPLKYLTPVGWLEMWESEVSQPQNKVRLALYGLAKGDSELGRAIGAMEYQLNDYVKFNNNTAWLDEKAPITEILNSFTAGNATETAQWFQLRFKPIYLTYQSALRMVGYKSLQEFDRSKSPNVLKIIEQVRVAIIGIKPYPLDITAKIDKEIPIMHRQETETVVTDLMATLNEIYADRDVNADGLMTVTSKIKTAKEFAEGIKSANETGMWAGFKNWINKESESVEKFMFPEEAKAIEINIDDLHKDQDTELDLLTLVRLAAYGNIDNVPWRVDAVLRLERYCESVTSYASGDVKFVGRVNEIYNLFKNSFRINESWSKEWMEWFNQRFLPVFKQWFSSVYKLRRDKPGKVWRTMTATNKHQVAYELTQVMVEVDGDKKSIWDIDASPFMRTESGTESTVVNPFMNNLEQKATEAKLKMPELELAKSKPTDVSSDGKAMISGDREKAMMDRLLGKKGLTAGTGGSEGAGSLYAPNVPLYTPANGSPNTYSNTANGALGGGYSGPGSDTLSQLERDAGSQSGGGTNFSPEALQTKNGFKISEKDAIKTIINEFVKAGITDNRVLAFALANAKSETGFQGSAESLNYSADRLPGIFKSTFGKNPGLAARYGRSAGKPADQKAIANVAYGNKYGNQGGDDGWMYRGRGFTQLTFKGNYKAVGDAIGEDIASNPEKVTTDPITAAKSAAGFFKIHPEIAQYVQQGNIAAAAKVVGLHQEGIQNKVNFYPDFLKRLTQGDLKDVLSSDENANGATEGDNPEGTQQVSPQPASEAVPGSGNTPQDAVTNAAAASPTQQAANRVNAPPQNEDGSADMSAVAPVTPAPATPAAPETPAPAEPAAAPPPVAQEPAPAPAARPEKPKKEEPAPAPQVALPDGVMKVSDVGVVQAIANLAEVLQRGMGNQSSLGGSRRVPTD